MSEEVEARQAEDMGRRKIREECSASIRLCSGGQRPTETVAQMALEQTRTPRFNPERFPRQCPGLCCLFSVTGRVFRGFFLPESSGALDLTAGHLAAVQRVQLRERPGPCDTRGASVQNAKNTEKECFGCGG